MVIKYNLSYSYSSQRWDDIHFTQFQSCGSHSASQSRQVVFVGIADFLNQAVLPQPLKKSGHLVALFVFDDVSQGFVTEPTDVTFPPDNRTEQFQVVTVKEIKTTITAVVVFDRPGYPVEVSDGDGRVIDSRDKRQISAIGSFHQIDQQGQAVEGFFQRCGLHFPGAVAMFHLSVVCKEGHIIGHRFHPKDDTELVIHLDGHLTHSMFDTGSFHPGVEGIAHFILVAAVEFPAKEGGNILGFDRVNRGAHNFVIDRFKITLSLEDDIRGIFDLHQAPVIVVAKVPDDRAVLPDDFIELTMQSFYIDIVRQLLGLVKIVNVHKDIVEHFESQVLFAELQGQKVMPVTIELQPKRRPGWHTQITQTQGSVNEVEVVMKALAAIGFQKGSPGLLVMPGLVAVAGFHGREDMHQSGMRTPLLDNLVNAVFFSEILFADKLDFRAVLQSDTFGICANLLPQRFSPLGIVENTNLLLAQKQTHALGVTNTGYGSGQYDSVKTGKNPFDFGAVPLDKVLHCHRLPYQNVHFDGRSEKCQAA